MAAARCWAWRSASPRPEPIWREFLRKLTRHSLRGVKLTQLMDTGEENVLPYDQDDRATARIHYGIKLDVRSTFRAADQTPLFYS